MPFPSPALPTAAYIDPVWFEKEKTLLFGRMWQFFTLASLVDTHNKFVTKKMFGVPVVVQNFSGELKAFENICLHRQALIQTEPHGTRPLACSYHGWSYGVDGKVINIPYEAEYYKFAPETKNKLCLKEFPLVKIGGLIFINMSVNPISLEQQFSTTFIKSLTEASSHLDNEFVTATYHRRFNWKLIFENLRDGLHASFLHRSTLYKDVKFRPAEPSMDALHAYIKERTTTATDPFDEVRTWFSKGGPDAPIENFAPQPWHNDIERYGNENIYYNWLAFPNFHMASSDGGHTFIIEHYMPQTSDRTDVEVFLVTARRKNPDASLKIILEAYLAGAERLHDEDFRMVEHIQDALHPNAPPPNWGAFELRNHRIASWMAQVVNGEITI